MKPWDMAAGILLVREAGGLRHRRRRAAHTHARDRSIVAGNQAIHKALLAGAGALEP